MQRHRDLVKANAIQAFDTYFEESIEKERIMEFVKAQRDCESPKTRKMANEFLKKWIKE